jgi:hypothetical protein
MSFGNLNAGKLLIDSQLVDAEGGATYENINPATETSLGNAADASAGAVPRSNRTRTTCGGRSAAARRTAGAELIHTSTLRGYHKLPIVL